ncbi:citrate lyase holo-[acyl-carrier protein] synthase [Vibrio sp. V27_P1S3P104]|uniref:citrate lyase holo-[acyl-carrier protein] synthase n=1 Tax=Vibrio TaxID=662 RepID=UPI000C162AAD|nr:MULTISPECIES: citrate lyase holo-[acyl-carrier protein] synthase [Vibrio]NAW70774.1 citrate lyase holo-[acyl-carrier protein] synthase [Vibrio sp. V28_P6S34P95]NAX06055.1 citrate lyase holo-[acyl-carrier protein] synthase [Vibrio sp. V30_P3S12P165]NAX35622.1 citrate lyase holo-[acyl-carrier protein] synthase [Vibrio sp. V29_P1S30P107]NAX38350.1 citrate lyase holo-[acyl-carrier protein] synthase [Vibrio sp. V27_P1S3P104]NAX40588.1 citrate lyase holo-[acyl-carrier protein] synthase [Vibrio sp
MSLDYGQTVSLDQVLANKEARVQRQAEWLKRYSLPLVSFSVNMPGPLKMTDCTKLIFDQGVQAIQEACIKKGWRIEGRQLLFQLTGPEAIFSVRVSEAIALKRVMIAIENQHRLGRVMDIDIIDVNGKVISRKGQGMARRTCYICDNDAVVCARSRRHDVQTLVSYIEAMVCHDQCCS